MQLPKYRKLNHNEINLIERALVKALKKKVDIGKELELDCYAKLPNSPATHEWKQYTYKITIMKHNGEKYEIIQSFEDSKDNNYYIKLISIIYEAFSGADNE